MESIKDKVAIVGMGCSKFGDRWDAGSDSLMVEACYEAFEDAGLESKDIQGAWLGIQMGGTGQPLAGAIKTEYIPITRVENACASGAEAVRLACHAVAAGIHEITLAVGVEKFSDSGMGRADQELVPGVPPPSQFALFANRYFHQYGLSYEEGRQLLAKISVKNHHNGSLNPKAQMQRELTIEEVINAPMTAYPLGLYDCCGVSDGCAAAIVTTPEKAKSLGVDYILAKGFGLAIGGRQGQLRDYYDFTHFDETVAAARQAYEAAGIKDARKELDLAEVHDCMTIAELISYEDLGWSQRGKAKEDIESGFFELTGGLPVNPDGGLESFGHPIGASGIRMIYEIYKQLQGKAGPRQIKNARIGLAHVMGGEPGSFSCAVTIWGRRD